MDNKADKSKPTTNKFEGERQLFEDIEKETLSDLKGSEKVERIASHILISKDCVRTIDSDNSPTLSPKEIIAEYKNLAKNNDLMEIPENTFRQMLSQLSKEDGSLYLWQDKDNNRRYFFKDIDKEELAESVANSSESTDEKATSEKDIYPILEEWLKGLEKYDFVKTVADSRSRGGSAKSNSSLKWKYPDIIAVEFKPNLLAQDKHFLTTIEVKTTYKNWQQDIFEAVSHSMFAHYSYFAFVVGETERIDSDIKKYANFFSVGILKITIPDTEKQKLENKKDIPYQKLYNEGKIRIDEYVQAPYHEPDFDEHYDYLGRNGVKTIQDLRDWGKK